MSLFSTVQLYCWSVFPWKQSVIRKGIPRICKVGGADSPAADVLPRRLFGHRGLAFSLTLYYSSAAVLFPSPYRCQWCGMHQHRPCHYLWVSYPDPLPRVRDYDSLCMRHVPSLANHTRAREGSGLTSKGPGSPTLLPSLGQKARLILQDPRKNERLNQVWDPNDFVCN